MKGQNNLRQLKVSFKFCKCVRNWCTRKYMQIDIPAVARQAWRGWLDLQVSFSLCCFGFFRQDWTLNNIFSKRITDWAVYAWGLKCQLQWNIWPFLDRVPQRSCVWPWFQFILRYDWRNNKRCRWKRHAFFVRSNFLNVTEQRVNYPLMSSNLNINEVWDSGINLFLKTQAFDYFQNFYQVMEFDVFFFFLTHSIKHRVKRSGRSRRARKRRIDSMLEPDLGLSINMRERLGVMGSWCSTISFIHSLFAIYAKFYNARFE